MKQTDRLMLAMRNIRRNPGFSLKIAGMVFTCAVLLCTMLTYVLSLHTSMEVLVKQKMSLCQNAVIADSETAEMLIRSSGEYTAVSELNLRQMAGESIDEIRQIYLSSSSLEWNGIHYEGINDFTYDFDAEGAVSESAYAVPFRIDVLVSGSTLLAGAEQEEFQQKFDKEASWLTGRLPQNPGELLMSDYMLEKYGISKEKQSSLIGETVSLYLKDICILENYTLCGIADADIFYLHGKERCAQIYVTETAELSAFHVPSYIVRLFAEDFSAASVQRTELLKDGCDLLSNEAITLFTTISMQQVLIGHTSAAVCAAVLLAMSVALFSMLQNYVQQKSGYYRMLQCMGLRAKQLCRLFFAELLLLSVPSLLSGLILSQFLADYILQIASQLQEHSLEIFFWQKALSVGSVCIYFVLWMFVCSVYELRIIQQRGQ
ncbi:MAG: FtsX-like permease family protein [Ruminococcus sp.]|nr:FtsX-like permease family protein [Ruminococcus sp.]